MRQILRPGLLDGLRVDLRGDGAHLREVLARLGAHVDEPGAQPAEVDALVLDCSPWTGGDDESETGAEPLLSLLDGVWAAVLAVAVERLIPAARGGRILFIAPARGTPAAAAALENLSRTLSVEWARHSITVVTLVPGPGTDEDLLATVVAYLLSPAGAYFSGTRLELDSLSR